MEALQSPPVQCISSSSPPPPPPPPSSSLIPASSVPFPIPMMLPIRTLLKLGTQSRSKTTEDDYETSLPPPPPLHLPPQVLLDRNRNAVVKSPPTASSAALPPPPPPPPLPSSSPQPQTAHPNLTALRYDMLSKDFFLAGEIGFELYGTSYAPKGNFENDSRKKFLFLIFSKKKNPYYSSDFRCLHLCPPYRPLRTGPPNETHHPRSLSSP